eukprot:6492645-Prymnesium_polylepis.1
MPPEGRTYPGRQFNESHVHFSQFTLCRSIRGCAQRLRLLTSVDHAVDRMGHRQPACLPAISVLD